VRAGLRRRACLGRGADGGLPRGWSRRSPRRPYTYEWRSRQSGPSTSGTWSGWYGTGSSSVTYTSISSCGLNTNHLEARVTDAAGKQATGSYTVYLTNPC
jgi:hypothetical protein